MKREKRLFNDGVTVQYVRNHGSLAAWKHHMTVHWEMIVIIIINEYCTRKGVGFDISSLKLINNITAHMEDY